MKATVPDPAVRGTAVTAAMCRRLFEGAAIASLFDQADQRRGTQVHALSTAVLAYTPNIDDLGALGPTVERISQKHVGYAVHADHHHRVVTSSAPSSSALGRGRP